MTKKKCKKGWGCGNSCISRTRKCRSNTTEEGKKIVETFMQYINRTQEAGEMTGPMLPTVAIAKEADTSKFNSIAQDIIKPPPIKPLTPEEEALVTGEIMQAAKGYSDMKTKANRIQIQNPDITQAEAEALAQYIHHTYYSDMNRILYMNNLEQDEKGNYNVKPAVNEKGNLIAPKLATQNITDEVLEPRPSKVKGAEASKKALALLEAKEDSEEFSLDIFLAKNKLQETINKGKSIAEHQADYDEILQEAPETLIGQTFADFVANRGGDVRKGESVYSKEGVEVMKATDKAFKNALHKLDKATPESIAARYKSGNKHSSEFKDWDGNYRRFVDFDSPEALEGFMKQYTENVGEEIIHPAATSTTWRNSHEFFDKPDSLQIKVLPKKEDTEGVLVDRFKNLADEAEILYPPGQKFKVVSVGETKPESPSFSKFANSFVNTEFYGDMIFKMLEMDPSEFEGNSFLSEVKAEIDNIIQEPEDIAMFADKDLFVLATNVNGVKAPTLKDLEEDPLWEKIMPPDNQITKFIKDGTVAKQLTDKPRKEVILQEV